MHDTCEQANVTALALVQHCTVHSAAVSQEECARRCFRPRAAAPVFDAHAVCTVTTREAIAHAWRRHTHAQQLLQGYTVAPHAQVAKLVLCVAMVWRCTGVRAVCTVVSL
jgi:hypothetical protein